MDIQPKNSTTKKNIVVAVFVLLVIVGAYLYMSYGGDIGNANTKSDSLQNSSKPRGEATSSTKNQTTNEEKELPSKISLKVPFTPQAPTANWDELHNEACEEASIIMAQAFFNGINSLPPEIVEREIEKLTKWQQQNFGYYLSINTEEVVDMIETNYGLKAEAVEISENTIKRALADGKLVIVPANGQMLDNPYFKQPGPIYHMFVITGYDSKNFITNDPGTKRGEDYRYTYETIEAATGNWEPGPHEVNLSDKKIIIVSK